MNAPAPPEPCAGKAALAAAVFGVVAVLVSQTISEGGTNSWSSLPAWATFAAFAALATLLPWLPGLSPGARASAWCAAAAGAGALLLVWVLFVLPTVYRNVAFLCTLGSVAAVGSVWCAPGRPPRAP